MPFQNLSHPGLEFLLVTPVMFVSRLFLKRPLRTYPSLVYSHKQAVTTASGAPGPSGLQARFWKCKHTWKKVSSTPSSRLFSLSHCVMFNSLCGPMYLTFKNNHLTLLSPCCLNAVTNDIPRVSTQPLTSSAMNSCLLSLLLTLTMI